MEWAEAHAMLCHRWAVAMSQAVSLLITAFSAKVDLALAQRRLELTTNTSPLNGVCRGEESSAVEILDQLESVGFLIAFERFLFYFIDLLLIVVSFDFIIIIIPLFIYINLFMNQSLISSKGKELAMLEDAVVAIDVGVVAIVNYLKPSLFQFLLRLCFFPGTLWLRLRAS